MDHGETPSSSPDVEEIMRAHGEAHDHTKSSTLPLSLAFRPYDHGIPQSSNPHPSNVNITHPF